MTRFVAAEHYVEGTMVNGVYVNYVDPLFTETFVDCLDGHGLIEPPNGWSHVEVQDLGTEASIEGLTAGMQPSLLSQSWWLFAAEMRKPEGVLLMNGYVNLAVVLDPEGARSLVSVAFARDTVHGDGMRVVQLPPSFPAIAAGARIINGLSF